MLELLGAVKAWPLLIGALVVFGLAPGLVLRLIALAFERDDPRRQEMLAELRGVPRWERPFWVAEQLEVALFEGVVERLEWAATGRIIHRWSVLSGVKMNRSHPDTFWIPDDPDKRALKQGDKVKLMFEMKDGWAERMWVEVTEAKRRRLTGRLINQPLGIPKLDAGSKIKFRRADVIDILVRQPGGDPEDCGGSPRLICADCGHRHNDHQEDEAA